MAASILELRHLATVQALAETGSLSNAARRLHLTQSALSHQLRALEGFFGTDIVEKTAKPIRLAPAGLRLLELAREILPRVASANRDIIRFAQGRAGLLRIAVQCHNCFDWLMPAMDTYRALWPEVELDLISGFVSDPVALVERREAELAVVHDDAGPREGLAFHPLFRYESVALMSARHPLSAKTWLDAQDFADQTLITYPVADELLDVMRHCLTPAGVNPKRRTAELTVAILQLVASGRGIAALPAWTVGNYIERGYVVSRPIGKQGLYCSLYAVTTAAGATAAYLDDFISQTRAQSLQQLRGVSSLD